MYWKIYRTISRSIKQKSVDSIGRFDYPYLQAWRMMSERLKKPHAIEVVSSFIPTVWVRKGIK